MRSESPDVKWFDDDKTLTLMELDLLRRLDGNPPVEMIRQSREVQPMAIRAVREIGAMRALLTDLLAAPCHDGRIVDEGLRERARHLLEGKLPPR